MWRGCFRLNISVAASFVWRCLSGSTLAPFPIPLIEPGRANSRIRLSDKTSRLHPRHVMFERSQAYEPLVPVEMRKRISPALRRLTLCLMRNHRRNRTAV